MSEHLAGQLPVTKVALIQERPPDQDWLIRSVWAREGVGIIGGPPKCCKSWLGLDMALSVASGTPCLDHFPVEAPGPALVYLAEDALPAVRARVQALCRHRGLDIQKPELYAISTASLRLDRKQDQERLAATLERFHPRLLLLDPLVRLHRLDENSAAEVSLLLGFLRELQRAYEVAVVLVHHASKKHRSQPGQALRGSSDLHAFGDSNAYLARNRDVLTLTLEHRAAKPPPPFDLTLASENEDAIHLTIRSPLQDEPVASLTERLLAFLRREKTPQTRQAIRSELRVQNMRLGEVLAALEEQDLITRTPSGWRLVAAEVDTTSSAADSRHTTSTVYQKGGSVPCQPALF